jgi:glutamine synthetase
MADCFDTRGNPVLVSPRQVLKKLVQKTRESGFSPDMGLEYEFYVFSENISSMAKKGYINLETLYPSMGWFDVNRLWGSDFLEEIRQGLRTCNVHVDSVEAEQGQGMFEIPLDHGDPVRVADSTVLFKSAVKEICRQKGLTASFMAKMSHTHEGLSGHVHQSLWDKDKKSNLFFDAKGEHRLSTLALQYIEGMLKTLPEFTAFFCPNFNSHKRLVPYMFTGTTTTWGIENRSTSLRIINANANGCRIEHRTPGADSNPYIVVSACLAGGLHGIENKLKARPVLDGDPYVTQREDNLSVPSFAESIDLLEQSALAKEVFGDEFIEHYVIMRRHELQVGLTKVSDWERERYLARV